MQIRQGTIKIQKFKILKMNRLFRTVLEQKWKKLIKNTLNFLIGNMLLGRCWNSTFRTNRVILKVLIDQWEKRWVIIRYPGYVSHYRKLFTLSFSVQDQFCERPRSTQQPVFLLFEYIKGTLSWDRFRQCWRKLTDVGLNKGRGWFLNFSEAPLIFSWNKISSFR